MPNGLKPQGTTPNLRERRVALRKERESLPKGNDVWKISRCQQASGVRTALVSGYLMQPGSVYCRGLFSSETFGTCHKVS